MALRRVALVVFVAFQAGCLQAMEPEWARDFDSVAQQFELIQQAQAQDTASMPPEARAIYQNMRGAFDRMGRMNSAMMQSMHGRGLMGGGGTMSRQGMGAGMFDATTMMRFREINQQMLSYSLGMQQMMGRTGHPGMADMYGQMADRMQGLLSRLPQTRDAARVAPEPPQSRPDGATVFAVNCSGCHGTQGEGLAGAFPPLNGSAVVTGPSDISVGIILHGLQGTLTVAGQRYDGVMPAFGATLSDAEIAAALSYARALPGNGAGNVTPADVARRRNATASREGAFTAAELGLQ